MPTYDYLCQQCGHEFELFQSITASPSRKCPECGKHGLKRLIGRGAGIIFKGSGFYETDYRSDNYRTGEASDKPAAEKKSDKKAEAKTDTKSESKDTKKDSASKPATTKSKNKKNNKKTA
jgi:putative FmdB family regulatory protein